MAAALAEGLLAGRPGEVYTLGGHNLPTSSLVGKVCELSGVPAPRRLPYSAAMALAAAEEITSALQKRRPRVTRDLVRASALYTFASSEKAEEELGYRVRPFEAMVRDTLTWAIAEGRLSADKGPL